MLSKLFSETFRFSVAEVFSRFPKFQEMLLTREEQDAFHMQFGSVADYQRHIAEEERWEAEQEDLRINHPHLYWGFSSVEEYEAAQATDEEEYDYDYEAEAA